MLPTAHNRFYLTVLSVVGFFFTIPAHAYLYACAPGTITGANNCTNSQSVPAEYLSLTSNVLMCRWPDPTTATYYQTHSITNSLNCSGSGGTGIPEWHPLSAQTNVLLPIDTTRFTLPVFTSTIGLYNDSNSSNSTAFDFSSYLATGTAAQFFAAGLSMVAAALLTGHVYRVILSMLK